MKIVISKIEYDYETSTDNRTISILREDGAWATYHDDENNVDDWEDWIVENIQEGDIVFSTREP